LRHLPTLLGVEALLQVAYAPALRLELVRDGRMKPSDRPGLGVELDEDVVRRLRGKEEEELLAGAIERLKVTIDEETEKLELRAAPVDFPPGADIRRITTKSRPARRGAVDPASLTQPQLTFDRATET
jgi:hypothetical protein